VRQARLEAEKRTGEYDGAKAAYDAACGEVKDLEKGLPKNVVLVTKALDGAVDDSKVSKYKTQLLKLEDMLDADQQMSYLEWNSVRGELAGLEKARDQAFEKSKAADKLFEDLRDKEAREEAREGAAVSKLKQLSEYPDRFSPTASGLNIKRGAFEFEFVKTPGYLTTKKKVEQAWANFVDQKLTFFDVAVVDGTMGSGKSRLCYEVGESFAREHSAQSIFLDCSGTIFDFSSESDVEIVSSCLAEVLFRRFAPETVARVYEHGLTEVLQRIKDDTGSTLVVLQVDEYSRNPELARALIRACRELFRQGPDWGAGVLVVPVLSGIPYATIRRDLVVSSDKTRPFFVTLTGVEAIDELQATFYKTAGIPTDAELPNLNRITATFGGIPRLFENLYVLLKDDKIGFHSTLQNAQDLGADSAGILYDAVVAKHKAMYGIVVWQTAFSKSVKRNSPQRPQRAKDHLSRIHTLAVTGTPVPVHGVICPSSDITLTYSAASATGLFTFIIDSSGEKGVIDIPLLTLDAYCEWSGVCPQGTLSPFSYTWQSMEFVAMVTLRCRWNSIFYTQRTNTEISVAELRPGAHFNATSIEELPAITVDKELLELVELSTVFKGDTSTMFKTQRDGKGTKTQVTDRSIFLLAPNQAGNDGIARLDPIAWLNQTKSQMLVVPSTGEPSVTVLQQSAVNNLVQHQGDSLEFNFGAPVTHLVFDLFSNRNEGQRFKADMLPDNTFLTTRDNYHLVVGNVFKHTIALFD